MRLQLAEGRCKRSSLAVARDLRPFGLFDAGGPVQLSRVEAQAHAVAPQDSQHRDDVVCPQAFKPSRGLWTRRWSKWLQSLRICSLESVGSPGRTDESRPQGRAQCQLTFAKCCTAKRSDASLRGDLRRMFAIGRQVRRRCGPSLRGSTIVASHRPPLPVKSGGR